MKILQNLENAYRAQAPTIRFSMGGVGIASIPEPRDVEAAQYTIDRCMEQLENAVKAFEALVDSGHLTLHDQGDPMSAVRGILNVLKQRNEIIVGLQGEVAWASRGPITQLPEAERAKLAADEPYFVLRAGVAAHARVVGHIDQKIGAHWREWYAEAIGPKPGQEWIRKGNPGTVFIVWGPATSTSEGFQYNDNRAIIYFDKSSRETLLTELRVHFVNEFEPAPASKTL